MQSQVRFNVVPEKVPEKVLREALVQSQVRPSRVPQKVAEKVPGSLGAKPSQVQRVPEKVAQKVLEIFGAGPGQVQRVLEKVPWKLFFSFLFFKMICTNKILRLLGIPPKLIFPFNVANSWLAIVFAGPPRGSLS